MKRFLRRPSPAMIVAGFALLVALGGVGTAAVIIPRNSVGNAQLRPNSVTSPKIANGSLLRVDFRAGQVPRGPAGPAGLPGPAGPAGPAGAAGPAGPGATAKWALVRPDGGIAAQSGGITLTAKPGAGHYILDFGSVVAGKLILVSGGHAGGGTGSRGAVHAGPCNSTTEGSTCPVGNDTNHLRVFTLNPNNNNQQDHSFYVAVFG